MQAGGLARAAASGRRRLGLIAKAGLPLVFLSSPLLEMSVFWFLGQIWQSRGVFCVEGGKRQSCEIRRDNSCGENILGDGPNF